MADRHITYDPHHTSGGMRVFRDLTPAQMTTLVALLEYEQRFGNPTSGHREFADMLRSSMEETRENEDHIQAVSGLLDAMLNSILVNCSAWAYEVARVLRTVDSKTIMTLKERALELYGPDGESKRDYEARRRAMRNGLPLTSGLQVGPGLRGNRRTGGAGRRDPRGEGRS